MSKAFDIIVDALCERPMYEKKVAKTVLLRLHNAGFVIVPKKATKEMIEAGANFAATNDWDQFIHDCYSTMINEYIDQKAKNKPEKE